MNILILNWRDPKNPLAGGAEKLNMHILEPLIKRGDNVIWYSKKERGLPSEELFEGIKIIRFGNVLAYFLALPLFLILKKFGKVDLVIDCIHGLGNMTPVIMPKTKKKILIYEVAQNIWNETFPFPISTLGQILERFIFLIYYGNKFWTISKSTEDDLIKMGIKKENITIIPMGFDAPNKIKNYPKYKTPTALFVGRLVEMKGIKDAIKAISKTKNWQLNVIGRGELAYEEELKKLVNDLEIKKRVKFLGFVPEAKKFEEMAKAWVLLVPSSREGWGMIVGEANHVGTQVIGYRSPGLIDSLKYYSKSNILVGNARDMETTLVKIKKPVNVSARKYEGWELLNKSILKLLKNA